MDPEGQGLAGRGVERRPVVGQAQGAPGVGGDFDRAGARLDHGGVAQVVRRPAAVVAPAGGRAVAVDGEFLGIGDEVAARGVVEAVGHRPSAPQVEGELYGVVGGRVEEGLRDSDRVVRVVRKIVLPEGLEGGPCGRTRVGVAPAHILRLHLLEDIAAELEGDLDAEALGSESGGRERRAEMAHVEFPRQAGAEVDVQHGPLAVYARRIRGEQGGLQRQGVAGERVVGPGREHGSVPAQ